MIVRIFVASILLSGCAAYADPDRDERRPERPRRQAEIALRLIEASSTPAAKNNAETLVPAELKTLLRYTRYGLLDSAYLRGEESEWLRITLAGNLRGRIRFDMSEKNPIRINFEIEGPPDEKGKSPTLLDTATTAKSGETVVLGASRMRGGDKGLIVLVTLKQIP